jgi:hypothetical protein
MITISLVAADIKSALFNILTKIVLDFLPGGAAFSNFDDYVAGFLVWLVIISLSFTGLILFVLEKIEIKYKNYLRKKKDDALYLLQFKKETKQRETILWETQLLELESIIEGE